MGIKDENNTGISAKDFEELKDEIHAADGYVSEAAENCNSNRAELNDLQAEIENLAKAVGAEIPHTELLEQVLSKVNDEVDDLVYVPSRKIKAFPRLSAAEILISSVSGLISVLIDVVLVGTPEIVKIYRGEQRFDGSVLTKILREIGNDDKLSQIFKWLEEKCTVPYDISKKKDVVYPKNHRLRSLAHDPFLGLFFAVADTIMGTTTCIDDIGKLTILINKNPADMKTKLLSVFYYIGHILSDMFTFCGIPIPGFFLTQFFACDKEDRTKRADDSLAEIAENMYTDGYDLRHLASMSVPVIAKNLIIDAYLALTEDKPSFPMPIAESELSKINSLVKKEKMLIIANAIATTGNVVKLVAPPNCGNPAAINIVQWSAMIINGINISRAGLRDKSAELILEQRTEINRKWDELLEEQPVNLGNIKDFEQFNT